MKASETKFQPIIEGTKQYVVPLFQRAYNWDKKEWQVLWDDLVYLCENDEPRTHFIGSIVTMPTTSVPEGVAKYLLIDGQQRLTTIFILLALLRDLARDNDGEKLANEINQTMLVNPFKDGLDYYKLLPTQVDRVSFQDLIQQKSPGRKSSIDDCYQFFKHKLKQGITRLPALNKVITTRLLVVSIVLDHDDNPHLVFESLNAKGRRLTEADLIRNYFFMRINVKEQEEVYGKYWEPMQTTLGEKLTECIRHYLMRNGGMVKQDAVYFTLKERIGQSDALPALKEIAVFAGYYRKLIDPDSEPKAPIRNALVRLNRLEVTTAYPFLLNCYHDYAQAHISLDDFVAILQTVENFVVRRFVCNVASSTLNKMFPLLYDQAKFKSPSNLVHGVRSILQTCSYPKDIEFQTRLTESKLYGAGERAIKTKLILQTLEASFQHKEQALLDKLTIEHVMPQTPTDWWQHHLGDDWQTDHELCLHTLGNLTLTAYNAELSNASFPKKQKSFTESHVELNRYFQSVQRWSRVEIEARSLVLADMALTIWPYFGEDLAMPVNAYTVKGRTPRAVTILLKRFLVGSWVDVLRQTLSTIADLEPDLFAALAADYPRHISLDATKFRRKHQLANDFYIETNLSSKDVYRFCIQAIESIGLSAEDWVVETE